MANDILISNSILKLVDASNGIAASGQKQKIAIITSFNEASGNAAAIIGLIKAVKAGIVSKGAIPYEMPVSTVSNKLAAAADINTIDTISQKNICASIEILLTGFHASGVVFIPHGLSAMKGMMLAATSLNVPSIFVGIGANAPSVYKGKELTEGDLYIMAAKKYLGKISEEEFDEYARSYLPVFGEGEGMNTENSLMCAYEALGMTVKNMSSSSAGSMEHLYLASKSGETIVNMVENQLVAKKILSRAAFTNACSAILAASGCTNTLKFMLELSAHVGYDIGLAGLTDLAKKTPCLVNIHPTGTGQMQDFHRAGGIYGIFKRLQSENLLNNKAITISGTTVDAEVAKSDVYDNEIIKKISEAYLPGNGAMVLSGNIPEKGALIRRNGIFTGLTTFSGYAYVYDTEQEACKGIYSGRIKKGSVIVVKNQGLKSAPGLNTINFISAAVAAAELNDDVLILTDGNASSMFNTMTAANILPETYEGETFALIQDGDIIELDFTTSKLNIKMAARDIFARKRSYLPFKKYEPSPMEKFFKTK